MAEGPAPAIGPDIYQFNLDLEVDIGWRMFTVTSIDLGAAEAGCFADLEQDETYSLGDFQVRAVPPTIGLDWIVSCVSRVFAVKRENNELCVARCVLGRR